MLTEEHVHQAREKLKQSQVERGMRELTKHGHLALVAILQFAFEQETPARIRDVYPLYRHIAEVLNFDCLRPGRCLVSFFEVRERFEQQLGMLGLVLDSVSHSTALDEVLCLDDVRVVDGVVAALLRHFAADPEERGSESVG